MIGSKIEINRKRVTVEVNTYIAVQWLVGESHQQSACKMIEFPVGSVFQHPFLTAKQSLCSVESGAYT
jgi:hypothetical protein